MLHRPTRVVALALIAVLVAGLVYVRFAPGAGPVTVPEGASAGDLILEPCEYAAENGSYAADCGTLVVPETRADPESRLIALPVTRIRARSDDPKEPVFFLTGGPGQSNMDFSTSVGERASRYVADRDFVLVGYRGIDGSVRLDCPEVESALKRSTDVLSDEFFRAYGDAHRSCADRLTKDGVDVASYGLVQQIDDLETARVAFGYDRINLLSESAGTRTAMIYAWRYPESISRSVMVAVNPPGNFLLDADTTDEQIGRYAALCADDDSCRTRTDDLAATMRRTAADIPDRWLFLPIKDANVRVVSMFGLLDSTAAASPTPAPMTLDAWLSAAEGDASGFWSTSVLGDLLFPELFVRGQYAAAPMLDAQAARDYFARGQGDLSNLGRAATAFTWGGGVLADSWPAAPEEGTYSRVRTSEVETLLIGGELDPMTPPQVATTQLLPYLPNGHQVVLPGFGHQGTVFREQPEAGSRLINTFFDSGQVDDSLYVPASIDFTPSLTFGAIAKTALGAMLALAGADRALPARNGSPGAHAGPHRAEVRRVAPVGLPARARPGRMVPRRPDRPHDHARRPHRQRAARHPVRRCADRPRDLLGMGASRLFGPEQACRTRRGGRRRARGRLAGLPRHGRPVGPSHRDRRSPRRRQPRVVGPRHVPGPIHPESVRRTYDDGGCA